MTLDLYEKMSDKMTYEEMSDFISFLLFSMTFTKLKVIAIL